MVSACTSTGIARRPSRAIATHVPGSGRPRGQEQARRIRHLGDPGSGHLEAADLVGRPEPVLERADEPQRGLPVALEMADDVDEVLQDPGAGDLTVLRDVADDDDRQAAVLGDADQRRRRPRAPARAGRRRPRTARRRRSAPSRRSRARGRPRRCARGSCRDRSRPPGTARRAGRRCARRAAAPARWTPRRSRTARAGPVRAAAAATSSSSVDLPTPGSPLSRIAAPGTMPPPSTRSNSATPLERRGDSSEVSAVIGSGAATRGGGDGLHPAHDPGRRGLLGDRAPLLALAAPAHPLRGRPAALGADVCGGRGSSGSHGLRLAGAADVPVVAAAVVDADGPASTERSAGRPSPTACEQ